MYRDTQNIIHFLRERESGIASRRNCKYSEQPSLAYERNFYKCILPTFTVQAADTPSVFLRQFTPDGKLLLSFSIDQRSLVVWQYRGIKSAYFLLENEKREVIYTTNVDEASMFVKDEIFYELFKKKFTLNLAYEKYARFHLHREFSIFFDDGRYVLLGSMGITDQMIPQSYYLRYPDMYDELELFNYVFFLIDLEAGLQVDVMTFPYDNILLPHNHGVSAYGKTIAVLSKYRQCIMLFQHLNGKIVPLGSIGPFYDCQVTVKYSGPDVLMPYTHLRQRILAHMFMEIYQLEPGERKRKKFKDYYAMFLTFENMIMEKAQLLNNNTLLIRYEERQSQMPRVNASNCTHESFKLYVFYELFESKVLKVCQKDSIELLYMLRNHCDDFRNVRSLFTHDAPSSPSNSVHFRHSFNNAVRSMHPGEAAIRFNPTLPVSTQSYSISQYLNYSLFNYDDRAISALKRPKFSSHEPIRFSDRNTNLTKFRLHLIPRTASRGPAISELVAFIFHPYDPLIISIQKVSTRYLVNLHLYCTTTEVKE